MIWTQERLARLAEVNKERKIPRYFAIKKLVEDIVEEETSTPIHNPTTL
jgi:hypothetical protein